MGAAMVKFVTSFIMEGALGEKEELKSFSDRK
jgi:hypothetical protein